MAMTITSPANEIVSEAHEHLLQLIPENAQEYKTLVLSGGVFNHEKAFTRTFQKKLEENGFQLDVLTVRSEGTLRPSLGALLLALGIDGSEGPSSLSELKMPSEELIKTVRDSTSDPRFGRLLENG